MLSVNEKKAAFAKRRAEKEQLARLNAYGRFLAEPVIEDARNAVMMARIAACIGFLVAACLAVQVALQGGA